MSLPAVRLVAAEIVDEVIKGASLTKALALHLPTIENPRDRSFVQAVCFGVFRLYPRLEFILKQLLKKPLKAADSVLYALLLTGLYQLAEMRVPVHSVVDETVNATRALKKSWASGFVNAILREYLRQKEALDKQITKDLVAHYAHPKWWIETIKTAWPSHWQDILAQNNEKPPFALRVNLSRISREAYLSQLTDAHPIDGTTSGIIATPMAVDMLPGFKIGEVSVQDGGAQLAAPWLKLAPGQHVLDACAAPGGKLLHLLETEPQLSVVAVEKDASRMAAIEENLKRLNYAANCICADASQPEKWWDGQLFDRILLDAPCSASGVIRRHPDIKILRQKEDLATLPKIQTSILNALWKTLKPGGLLLYATCSVLPTENILIIKDFLRHHSDASEEIIDTSVGLQCEIGRQILPGMLDMDGFYYARLKKENPS